MNALHRIEFALVILLSLLGVWFLATRPIDDRLDAMLPRNPTLQRSMELLEKAKLAGKVIVEIRTSTPDVPHDRFVAALDTLKTGLPSPLITRVITPGDNMPTPADLQAFAAYAPQLLGPETYPELERRVTEEGIHQSLKGMRRTLLSPQSMALSDWFRTDPLGARATALKPLQSLGKALGYQVIIEDGHFFTEDHRAAMLILETPVLITDHAESTRLIEHIEEQLAKLPPGLQGTIIAGHRHTLSNQQIIRRDIGWTSTLATVFFIALFIIHFRDLRSVLIFIIPTIGILMGIACVQLTGAHMIAIVLGMGGVLAGIAIDYGIHVYVALSRPETDRSNHDAVRLIRRSIWTSALTTIAPIAGLMLSTIPGYRQLGILSSLALLFSLLIATRLLPRFFPAQLKALHAAHAPNPSPKPTFHLPPRFVVGAFLACLAAALILAYGIRIDLDFSRLDGTEQAIIQEEAAFASRWGGGPGTMGIVAVWDKDPEKARQANDTIYEQVRAASPDSSNAFLSIAAVQPARRTRERNAALWLDFWNRHETGVRDAFLRLSPTYGFTTNAFASAFLALRDGTDPAVFAPSSKLLATFEQQFIRTNKDETILLSFYPDTPAMADATARLHDIPAQYLCLSRTAIKDAFTACITSDLARQAFIGLSLIAILLIAMVRRPRTILLVCIPPIAGVAGMLAGLRLADQPLTPVTMIAGLLLAGNCIDYGVFMYEAWRRNAREELAHGVYLAWITTVAGSALLLVARHPVLYATGLALTIGLTCGFVAARWVMWSAATILRVPTIKDGHP